MPLFFITRTNNHDFTHRPRGDCYRRRHGRESPKTGSEHPARPATPARRNELTCSQVSCGAGCAARAGWAERHEQKWIGLHYAHDVRVIRLPRHGASCPVGIGVSCSADRQALGKITRDGVFLERLETDPARFLPDVSFDDLASDVVHVDLNRSMSEIRAELSRHPVKTRVMLSGPMIVARDIAHAKLKERLEQTGSLPDYMKNHCVYYAGPAKTPSGYASGAFGPTTAGRMDSYVAEFQRAGGSFVMLAKGNRSRQVTDACQKFGGFYLGSVGGPAARLAQDCITKVEVLEYPELGMEAVWKIEVRDFPAFIVVDDKGNDFFDQVDATQATPINIRS